jgi:hypothetical protein
MSRERVRLALLLAVLAGLIVYFAIGQSWRLGLGGGDDAAVDCPSAHAPALAGVDRAQLLGMRRELRAIVPHAAGHLYEQGPVEPGYMWSDGEPGTSASLPPGPRHPGGYELRWWLHDGDDVVVDALVFADPGRARGFFEKASSPRCRSEATTADASLPPEGRNLVWRNPDGFAQEDLFMLRGRRVYRVAVVLADLGDLVSPVARHLGFTLVNRLACSLPDSACRPQGNPA